MIEFEFNEIPENEIILSEEVLEELNKVPVLKRDYESKHYFQNIKYASQKSNEIQSEINTIENEEQTRKLEVKTEIKKESEEYSSLHNSAPEKEKGNDLEEKKKDFEGKQKEKIEEKKQILKSYQKQQENKNEYLGKTNLDEIVGKIEEDIEIKEDNLESAKYLDDISFGTEDESIDLGSMEKLDSLERETDMSLVEDMKLNIDTNYQREEYYIHVRKAMSNGADLGRDQVNGLKVEMLKESKEHEENFDDVVKMARNYTAIEKRDPELNKEFTKQTEQDFGYSRY